MPNKQEVLSNIELGGIRKQYYEPGKAYQWTLSYGWAIVGFYVRHDTPPNIVVQHANHFAEAGRDYGELARLGPKNKSSWGYEGLNLINVTHIIKVQEYLAEVPRSPTK